MYSILFSSSLLFLLLRGHTWYVSLFPIVCSSSDCVHALSLPSGGWAYVVSALLIRTCYWVMGFCILRDTSFFFFSVIVSVLA